MKRLFKFRYPKLLALLIISVLSYFIFSNPSIQEFFQNLNGLSYLGNFVGGILFSFGFSTPIAIGIFLVSEPENIYIASLIGGFGALMSDLFIFKIIRFSFMDEFKRLEKTEPIRKINKLLSTKFLHRIKNYLLYAFAGLIIASPLPDELGVSMLAGLTKIKIQVLAIISFIMNTVGIFIMLLIGIRI